ncbi:MAG: branched-chain amino acid ABC transporter permease [Acidimicrobiales bacterium]
MSPRVLVQGTPAQRWYTRISWGLFVLFVALVPFVFADTWAPSIFGDTYTIGMDNLLHAIAWMVAVLGLNLLIGYSGQISLGHSFFVGLGSYLSAVLMVSYDWPFLATFLVVVPVCFVFGMIVGIPALRIKGLYLALVTLVLATIFPTLVRLDAWADKTGGSNGLNASAEYHPPGWLPLDGIAEFLQAFPLVGGIFGSDGLNERGEERVWLYIIMVLIAAVMFWMARNVVRSRPGRAFVAIRDNETSAAVSGVNLPLYKTLAFGLSAAYGGVAGVMYTVAIGALAPDVFGINLAIFFIVGLVLGGVATISGAVIGGLAIIFIPHFSSQWANQTDSLGPLDVTGDRPYGQVLLGAFLIAVTFVLPGGIVAGIRKLRSRFVVVTPRPPVSGAASDDAPGGVGDASEDDEDRPALRRTEGSAALP